MEMAPGLPQEALAAAKGGVLVVRKELAPVAVLSQSVAVEVFRQPVQGVQVAQATLAVLDVGLDAVARLTRPLVPLVALGELGLHELPARAGQHLLGEAPL